MKILDTFLANEIGGTTIEYGLIVAFVSLAGFTFFQLMGSNISSFISSMSSKINGAQPGA